jgi:hypothetical protein
MGIQSLKVIIEMIRMAQGTTMAAVVEMNPLFEP